jgi:hypothetical protein
MTFTMSHQCHPDPTVMTRLHPEYGQACPKPRADMQAQIAKTIALYEIIHHDAMT